MISKRKNSFVKRVVAGIMAGVLTIGMGFAISSTAVTAADSTEAEVVQVTTPEGYILSMGTDSYFTYQQYILNVINEPEPTYETDYAQRMEEETTKSNYISGSIISNDVLEGLPEGSTYELVVRAEETKSVSGVPVTINEDGTFTYTHRADIEGFKDFSAKTDTFTCEIGILVNGELLQTADGEDFWVTQTVSVNVKRVRYYEVSVKVYLDGQRIAYVKSYVSFKPVYNYDLAGRTEYASVMERLLNGLRADESLAYLEDYDYTVTYPSDSTYVVPQDGMNTLSVYFTTPVEEDPTEEEPTTPENPSQEDPSQEEPSQEDPSQEEPSQENPSVEEPTVEDPTVEEPITGEVEGDEDEVIAPTGEGTTEPTTEAPTTGEVAADEDEIIRPSAEVAADEDAVQTGDHHNMILFIAMLLAAGCAGLVVARKKVTE